MFEFLDSPLIGVTTALYDKMYRKPYRVKVYNRGLHTEVGQQCLKDCLGYGLHWIHQIPGLGYAIKAYGITVVNNVNKYRCECPSDWNTLGPNSALDNCPAPGWGLYLVLIDRGIFSGPSSYHLCRNIHCDLLNSEDCFYMYLSQSQCRNFTYFISIKSFFYYPASQVKINLLRSIEIGVPSARFTFEGNVRSIMPLVSTPCLITYVDGLMPFGDRTPLTVAK